MVKKTESKIVNRILINSNTFASLLKELYVYYKKIDNSFTLAHICYIAKISSSGYLSDIMSGRRIIHAKYIEKIMKPFRLGVNQEEFAKLMALKETTKSEKEINEIVKKLESIRKCLEIRLESLNQFPDDINLAFELYSAIGLFNNKASIEDLKECFSMVPVEKLESYLETLTQMNMLTKSEERIFSANHEYIFFNKGEESKVFSFFESSLDQSKIAVKEKFNNPKDSIFVSDIISVSLESYQNSLLKLRALLQEFKVSIETKNANTIVRFNVQIFPTIKK